MAAITTEMSFDDWMLAYRPIRNPRLPFADLVSDEFGLSHKHYDHTVVVDLKFINDVFAGKIAGLCLRNIWTLCYDKNRDDDTARNHVCHGKPNGHLAGYFITERKAFDGAVYDIELSR